MQKTGGTCEAKSIPSNGNAPPKPVQAAPREAATRDPSKAPPQREAAEAAAGSGPATTPKKTDASTQPSVTVTEEEAPPRKAPAAQAKGAGTKAPGGAKPDAKAAALGKKPTVCIVIGMAGSGKTTLMQRLNASTHQKKIPSYIINLDPAVGRVPYSPNIDIRETVKYKEVMKQYNLGPNGGIMTSLNLFATRFGQVLGFLEKRAEKLDYVFIDTPGQIEVFTWSASGQIITDTLASAFPTVLVYVVDTPRTVNPVTFMSNMTYACSIMYKTQLPFVMVFNKTDVASHKFAQEWMTDFDAFEQALQKDKSYMSSYSRSMSLVLEEFYRNIRTVGVSAATGMGMEDFYKAVAEARQEYKDVYLPMVEKKRKAAAEKKAEEDRKAVEKIKKDMEITKGRKVKFNKTGQESS